MIFRHFVRDLFRRLPEWDAPSRLSLYMAVILLVLLLLVGFVGPAEIRLPARFGAFGLLLTLQLVIFWGNRRAISPYHEAQQQYIRGEYASARDLLGPLPEPHRASVDALVLLGNCYRQLGQYDKSKLAIERALLLKPDYHYALYAAGRLTLVLGEYAQACEYIERALSQGAPDVVHFDLGQACYYLGDCGKATLYLSKFSESSFEEPAKAMLAMHYLRILDNGKPPSAESIRQNINYWEDEASKYRPTVYGTAIFDEVEQLQKALVDNDSLRHGQPTENAL